MRLIVLCAGLMAAESIMPGWSRGDEASHRAGAEKLLVVMGAEKNHATTLDNLLKAQIRQNPAIMPMHEPVREFFTRHLGWEAIKEDMIRLYAEAFTEDELRQLVDFYQSPIGQKWAQQLPSLAAKSMQKAQERMREHLPELQATLKAAMEKAGAVPPPVKK